MLLIDARHRAPVLHGPRCAHDSGPRNPALIRLVCIHTTEGSARQFPKQPSAEAIARYGASSSARASWHMTVDQAKAIRCLPDDVISWTAPGANTDGLHVEICGWAGWSTLQWYRHQSTLKRTAWVVARWCVRYNIPPVWLTDRQLADGATDGLCTHAQVSRVFRKSDHSDPGPSFPRGYFRLLVKRRIKWLKEER